MSSDCDILKDQMTYKVIIIGAGVSGLSAANYLHKNGIQEILILEAKEKAGGRIQTVSFDESSKGRIEMGAQWIHGEESNLCRLVKASGHRHQKISWEGKGPFLLPNGKKVDENLVKDVLDWVERTIERVESSFTIESYQNGDYYSEIQRKSLIKESMGSFMKNEFLLYLNGQQITEESYEFEIKMSIFQWAMSFQRIDNSCNQMTDLSLFRWSEFEVCPGEHYNNFKEGASSFIDNILVKSLPKESIKLNSPVVKIVWNIEEENQKPVQVMTKTGKCFYADCILLTCSIGVLKETHKSLFYPELPFNLIKAIESSGFGSIGKVFLKWDNPWWPKETEGFQFLWPKEYLNCCEEDKQRFNEITDEELKERWPKSLTGFDTVLDSPNWLLGWLGGPEAVFVEKISEKEVGERCAKLLRDFTGFEISDPNAVYVSKWNNDEFFRGAYSFRSIESDGITGDISSILCEPVIRSYKDGNKKPVIFLAGEALSKSHYSTLHGAYSNGEEQAAKILKLFKDLKNKSIHPNIPNACIVGMPKCNDDISSNFGMPKCSNGVFSVEKLVLNDICNYSTSKTILHQAEANSQVS